MKYDGTLDIAVGLSVESKKWKNTKMDWSELVQRFSTEHKTSETFKEYMAASKDEQGKIKDVGGYVGGYLRGGRRKPENVAFRQLLTLDMDFAHADFWDDFQMQFDYAAVLHATHKHHENSPRYRLLMPLSREVTSDEYVAIARKIGGLLNIDLFDHTTFEPNRLMFWPSSPKDIDYYFRFQDGEWVDADKMLAKYVDWKDSSLWPVSTQQMSVIKTSAQKQEDPENKKGIIGAFCRTYSIQEAIAKFIPEIYVPTDTGRYTFVNGSTSAGVIIYEDKFAFSHHGTDPCSGKLCNAFDLIRIHKFGLLDDDSETASSKQKSFRAMEEFALKDEKVKKIVARENLQKAKYDFKEDDTEDDDNSIDIDDQVEWMKDLEADSKGHYLSTAQNIDAIFSNDIRLRGLFKLNVFNQKSYVFNNLPWRRVYEPEPLKNVDFSGIRNYIEIIYGIVGTQKIDDRMNLEFEYNKYHPVTDYLKALKWDGKQRIDTLLINYFGADDTIYTREAMRITLVGAVSRILRPGCKFDSVLTLVGSQGCGKSSFLKKLGQDWFSDTFMTVQGKDAFEQIQGSWIIEIAELSGLKKAEVEAVKHYISKQEDVFRPAYGKVIEVHKRQCIFIGTTNNRDFLRDPTGNRRFLPIDIHIDRAVYDVFEDLTKNEIDQIWAEAMALYRDGAKTIMSPEALAIATEEQSYHSESDERHGIVDKYLSIRLPIDWERRSMFDRLAYLDDEDEIAEKGVVERDSVCIAELWCECLGKNKTDMDRYKTRELNDIMRSMKTWEQAKSPKNFSLYGKQKYYTRKK